MNKKGIIALLLAIIMVISLFAGCSEKPELPVSSGSESVGGVDAKVIKFAHDHTITSPLHLSSLEFKDMIEERSNGRYIIDIYPTQQLGSSREMIEGMQMNSIELTFLPTAKFGGFDQNLNLADMPFLFPNEDIFFEVMEGEVGVEAMSGLTDIGIKGIAYIAEGYKSITNSIKPITKPEDLKGMKIRTMETPLIMDMFSAWGANPVPIDFSEVYNSLQQGVAAGQENPYLSTHDMKFYEVQDYMTISDHAYLSYFISASNDWWESLSEEDQEMFIQTSLDMNVICREKMEEANKEYYKVFEESGVEIYHLNDDEKALFREAVEPVYDKYRGVIDGDLLDKAINQVNELLESSN